MLAVIEQTGFITPVNFSIFFVGSFGNRRVFFIKSFFHSFWILFIGLSQRLLRSKSPAFQIFTHSSDRHLNRPQPSNQLLNCYTGPQSKRDLELIRTFILYQFLNLLFLICIQRSATTEFSPPFLCRYAFLTLPFILFVTSADGRITNSEDFLNLFLLPPSFAKSDRLKSNLLLYLWFKFSCVYFFHAVLYSTVVIHLP